MSTGRPDRPRERCGGHGRQLIEMGIATAMALHLAAALPRLSYPSYLMGPLKYRQQITEQQVEVVDGCVAVPAGPVSDSPLTNGSCAGSTPAPDPDRASPP